MHYIRAVKASTVTQPTDVVMCNCLCVCVCVVGGDGRFTINSETGEVMVVGRKMFVVSTTYTLAISAQVVGSAKKKVTPAQVLNIKVDDKAPQFDKDPYVIEMSEFHQTGDM